MKYLINKFYSEPVFAMAIPTILFVTAAGIWSNQYLAFGAAAFAALSALVARSNVTPINDGGS